jgi:hypothetical protein
LSHWTPITLLAGAVLCIPFITNAQSNTETKSLVLTTTVLSQGPPRDNVVEMNLRLRLTNVGDRPLILHRRSLLLIEVGVFEDVERPNADSFAQVSAMSYVPHPYSYISYRKIVGPRPSKDFIIIGPGQKYEIQEQVAASIRRRKKEVMDATDDRYLLTVKVSTWDASSQEVATKLRRTWSRYGRLWSETNDSEPMSFVCCCPTKPCS